MALIKIEANSPQRWALETAAAYGYHVAKNAPMWWDTFWNWYLSYVALVKAGRVVGAMVNTTPYEAMRWVFARALMENDYEEESAHTDLCDIQWYDEMVEDWGKHGYDSLLPQQAHEQRAVAVLGVGAAETNPWKLEIREVVRDTTPESDAAPIDYKAARQQMMDDERRRGEDAAGKGRDPQTIDDEELSVERRMELAQPGDRVDLKEPKPDKCLFGAPGSQLDDDKEFAKGAFCIEQGITPPTPEKKAERQQQFGATPAPTRPNRHQSIADPGTDIPVSMRLDDAQPGDRVSVVEPVPDKCLFGAPAVLPDDDVIHADVAFCDDGDDHGAEDDGDDPWDDDDDNYDDEDDEPVDFGLPTEDPADSITGQPEARTGHDDPAPVVDDTTPVAWQSEMFNEALAREERHERHEDELEDPGEPNNEAHLLTDEAVAEAIANGQVQPVNEAAREVLNENRLLRDALPNVAVTNDELDEQVDTDKPVRVTDAGESAEIDTSKDIVDELVENAQADVAIDESEETKHGDEPE